MENAHKPDALTEETLEKVAGGVIHPQPEFAYITEILKKWGDFAWSIEPWNGLWRAINEAETTENFDGVKRASKIKEALAKLEIFYDSGLYKDKLASSYDEMKSSLEYCLNMTENS